MKRNILVLAAIIAAAYVQSTWIHWISIYDRRPDLVVALVVYLGLRKGSAYGTTWGFVAGLLQDLGLPGPMGATALALSVVGFLSGLGWYRTLSEGLFTQGLVTFLGALAAEVIYLACVLEGFLVSFPGVFLTHSLPSAVYTAILGTLIVSLGGRALGFQTRTQ